MELVFIPRVASSCGQIDARPPRARRTTYRSIPSLVRGDANPKADAVVGAKGPKLTFARTVDQSPGRISARGGFGVGPCQLGRRTCEASKLPHVHGERRPCARRRWDGSGTLRIPPMQGAAPRCTGGGRRSAAWRGSRCLIGLAPRTGMVSDLGGHLGVGRSSVGRGRAALGRRLRGAGATPTSDAPERRPLAAHEIQRRPRCQRRPSRARPGAPIARLRS